MVWPPGPAASQQAAASSNRTRVAARRMFNSRCVVSGGATPPGPCRLHRLDPPAAPEIPRGAPATWVSASGSRTGAGSCPTGPRSEEHTSELQSRLHLVCRLLLEKKKNEFMTDKQAKQRDTMGRDAIEKDEYQH